MRYIFFIVVLLASTWLKAQEKSGDKIKQDSLVIDRGGKDSVKVFIPTIQDYRYKVQFGQYQVFDTVFSIDKYHQFTQYNNRDVFGKVPFANVGAGFQDLVYSVNSEENLTLLPTNKSHFIQGIQDICYYDVKTPTTAFVYHNGVGNGGTLKSTYTQNIGKDFNFALDYTGLRSQGFYRRSLTSSNNFTVSARFQSRNQKYQAYAHFTHQNVNAEEYGGIVSLDNFLNDTRFKNRNNLEVNLTSSDSRFSYRRYYYSHEFRPFSSERFPFKLRHSIFHQGNKYYFKQSSVESYFQQRGGSVLTEMSLVNKKYSENLSNTISLLWDNEKFKLDAGIRHQSISLGTGNAQFDIYKENRLGAVGNLDINLWDKLKLQSFLEISRGAVFGNYLKTTNHLKLEPIEGYFLDAKANFQSVAPSFNYLVNASLYPNFNYQWQDFKNQNILEIGGTLGLKWFDAKVSANYFRIDQMAYFNELYQPKQSSASVNISQIGGEALFKYGKFNFNPNLLFQAVLNNKDLLPLPHFVGRLNFYYQTPAFKKAAELQTGIQVYYFSKFNSREYAPVLNEFVLPSASAHSIGGQPIASAYFNMKVKRMLIYAEAQHFNTTFMKNRSYTAPYFPISDFRLNLGVVWYLFY
ncbi:putative porin [Riemerella anatipestifer]|uniref:putative porin n=1 Tax=Riemerella anatipestifer TaxID=34085 RepID=UPI001374CDCD|nr:putative porin [Riemerella anatipestifer]